MHNISYRTWMESAFMLNWVTIRRCSDSYVYGVCREKGWTLCTREYHTGPKTIPTLSHTFLSSHVFAPSAPSLSICAHFSLSEQPPLQKKSLFGSKAVASSPSLWLPNEALYCLIPSGTWRISQKKVLAVVHRGWWPSVRAHMLGTERFLLEPA